MCFALQVAAGGVVQVCGPPPPSPSFYRAPVRSQAEYGVLINAVIQVGAGWLCETSRSIRPFYPSLCSTTRCHSPCVPPTRHRPMSSDAGLQTPRAANSRSRDDRRLDEGMTYIFTKSDRAALRQFATEALANFSTLHRILRSATRVDLRVEGHAGVVAHAPHFGCFVFHCIRSFGGVIKHQLLPRLSLFFLASSYLHISHAASFGQSAARDACWSVVRWTRLRA